MSILRDLFTGANGTSHDIGRYCIPPVFVVALGLEIYSVVTGKPFDLMAYGLGVGALAVGMGSFLKIKESTEPGLSQTTTKTTAGPGSLETVTTKEQA